VPRIGAGCLSAEERTHGVEKEQAEREQKEPGRERKPEQSRGADGFCLQSFNGTEAAFRLICFLFNLLADFKRDITRDESPRLMTLRTQVLVAGAILGSDGRKWASANQASGKSLPCGSRA
jgi:hypothetical protein